MKARLLTLAVAAALSACGSDSSSESKSEPGSELSPGPGAFEPAFETSSSFFTRMSEPMVGHPDVSPHSIVQIYYSTNMEPVVTQSSFGTLPQGTVSIKKQDQDGDGTFDQLMVMIKQAPGTDPDNGDWVWEQRDPGTGALVSSSTTDSEFKTFCSSCHGGFPGTDWLAGTDLEN